MRYQVAKFGLFKMIFPVAKIFIFVLPSSQGSSKSYFSQVVFAHVTTVSQRHLFKE
jgi:hypothetical protein